MNSMNLAGMNAAQGGPVGGGMMMMNNGAPSTPANQNTQESMRVMLNTYIYDYFLNFGYHNHARALFRDEKFTVNIKESIKSSPGRRKDGEVNGMDENSMDTDSKDDLVIPHDLPRPQVPDECPGSAFLFDWFCLFHDIFAAQRTKKPNANDLNYQYLQQTQSLQRLRENQQNAQLTARGTQMMPGQAQFAGMTRMRNGMTASDMQRANMQKSMTPQQMQQLQQQQQKMLQQQQQQNQMQREHSDMDMNGHRAQSPADPDNAGSPSKRPRLGEQPFSGGQMVANGRGQGVAGVGPQAGALLMQGGMNPKAMTQAQFQGGFPQAQGVQQKLMQGGMPNGLMNPGVMANAGSPMMQGLDPQFMGSMPMGDLYAGAGGMRAPGGGLPTGPNAAGGNHALQDYQMQLMLLEQQNKKRLMMARQEQDNISRVDGGPMGGGPGMPPPGMSPGSRTGNSPNPTEQMKRGTPQLGGIPGSPGGGDGMQQGRGSPATMNFMSGMAQDFNPPMFMKTGNDGMTGPGGPGIRPATSINPNLNMDAMARAQQQSRMPGGNWQAGPQGQPMMPQPTQGQPQPMGTPGQREMPPPQAPATGSANAARTQPSSPQPAPPTPSQANKPNPKGKKDKNEPRKRPNKKNSTANAPAASEPDPPPTPTPSTPITPTHPNSFNTSTGKGQMAGAVTGAVAANVAPTSNPTVPQPPQIQQPDSIPGAGHFDPNFADQAFSLDFSGLDSDNVLNDFDFDSFLNNTEDGTGSWQLDGSLGTDGTFGLETTGVE